MWMKVCSNWTSGRCTFCSHTPGNVKIITESRVFTAYHGIRKYSTLKSFLWIRNVRNHVKKLKWSKKRYHDDQCTVQNTLEKPLKLTTNLWKDLRKQKTSNTIKTYAGFSDFVVLWKVGLSLTCWYGSRGIGSLIPTTVRRASISSVTRWIGASRTRRI